MKSINAQKMEEKYMQTVTLKELQESTGLSRQSIYNKAKAGELERVGKNQYTLESANALRSKIEEKKETIAPTRSGVTRKKLDTLEEAGIIKKTPNGRYTLEDIMLAKRLHVTQRRGQTVLTVHKDDVNDRSKTISLKDMAEQSGLLKSTLLHYIRSGQIEKVGKNTYTEYSFKKFIHDYEKLQKSSLLKAEVMEELGIDDKEYHKLLKEHKLEKASFERYTKKSVAKLKGMPKEEWDTKAPVYEHKPMERSYTDRELPDDQVMTYKEVAQALNRGKSTIIHLVKEGKLELVGRNRYAKDSVEAYLEQRDGIKPNLDEAKLDESEEDNTDSGYLTAKQVREELGIGKATHLNYYVKRGFIERAGSNRYTKESVDRYKEMRDDKASN